MTKRFTIEQTMIKDCIVDNATGEQLDTCDYTKRLCEILNTLAEENEQLKSQRLQWITNQQEVECLTEENEQLKAQLRKGEDVCGICKYQYLTKRDTDKYYIAKCKKEHIECSKGIVNYCEDFKCKEITK